MSSVPARVLSEEIAIAGANWLEKQFWDPIWGWFKHIWQQTSSKKPTLRVPPSWLARSNRPISSSRIIVVRLKRKSISSSRGCNGVVLLLFLSTSRARDRASFGKLASAFVNMVDG